MRTAARMVNPAIDLIGYSFALIAIVATIDGNAVRVEDLDEMDMLDIDKLTSELLSDPPAMSDRNTLPSGKKVVVRGGNGRDMRLASRIINSPEDPLGYKMALVSLLMTIDGEAIVLEDVEDLGMGDVAALLSLLPGNSPTPGTPSASSR